MLCNSLLLKYHLFSFLSAPEILKDFGVPIKSYGYINFDGKNNIEQWLVIQHPNRSEREFWILVQDSEKVNGLFVANITSNKPILEEFRGSNEYVITTLDGKSLISIESFGFTDQPYIVTHSLIKSNSIGSDDDYLNYYLIEEPLERITNQLLSGINPVLVQEELAQLNQSETFNCKKLNLCDKVYYLVGLTSELAGDNQAATENYVRLWKEYPSSLYAIMARSKLETP